MAGIARSGNGTFAQDKDSSVVHGMPGEAILLDAVMLILSPEKIGPVLTNLANNKGKTKRNP
jgi:two-component system chemotaxis response regulator CheB